MTSSSDQSQEEIQDATTEPASEGNMTEVPRARLTRLKINRFRNVKPGTELRFDDGINVLLGRNGTGKTTLLELVCALVRGNLSVYEQESFDLEFDMHVGHHRFTTSVQRTIPSTLMLAMIRGREQPQSWKYRLELYAPSEMIASAEGTPGTMKIAVAEENSEEVTAGEEMSPFDPIFYATPLLRESLKTATYFTTLFSVHQNCLRLDEGLDVFRAVVNGAILPAIERQLSIESTSSAGVPELDSYAPRELVAHIKSQGASLHEATGIPVDQGQFGVLDVIAHAIDVKGIRCSLMLLDRKQDADTGTTVSSFGKPSFWITTHRGTTFPHDKLSYGEKRLLVFLYHAAANPQILVADELVNGLHHEWIQACLDAIQGQAFLTSQNPLLLDHLPFSSAEEVQRRFILCDRDEHGDWIWRNMDQDAADAFYRAYEVGLQHVSEILETKGLW